MNIQKHSLIDIWLCHHDLFRLETLSWLFNLLAPGLIIAIAIVFQPELRKLFLRLGQNYWVAPSHRSKNDSIEAVLTAAEFAGASARTVAAGVPRGTRIPA